MQWPYLLKGCGVFVAREASRRSILHPHSRTSDGRPYWESAVDDALLLDQALECGPPPPRWDTGREWQILQNGIQELTTKEMAQVLGIAPKTREGRSLHT